MLPALLIGLTAGARAIGPPFDRVTGVGWVAPTTQHDYRGAQANGVPVSLLITETTGARNTMLNGILRILTRAAKAIGTQDGTRYGLSRASPKQRLLRPPLGRDLACHRHV